jgi:hypothetical protein
MRIACLPFPTSLRGEYGNHWLAVLSYAASLAVARLMLTAVCWYASSGRRLMDDELGPVVRMIIAYRIGGLTIPLLFLITICISFFSVNATVYSRVLLLVADNMLLRVLSKYGWWVVRISVSHRLA